MKKYYQVRANKDFTEIAIDFQSHENKWVTESIYKDYIDKENKTVVEIPAYKILNHINKMNNLEFVNKNFQIYIREDVEHLEFL